MKKLLSFLLLFLFGFVLVECTATQDTNDSEYTVAQKEQLLTEAFVAYTHTSEGKAAIQAAGGILAVFATDKSWDDIKGDHPVTKENNSNITIRFGGSTSVEGVAKALTGLFTPLAGNFKAVHDHTGSGDAVKRTWGSDKDTANKLHIGFASRGFSASEAETFGDAVQGRLSWDAVVPVVHPNNEASNVTAALLTDLYNGTVTNWSDVAGSNLTSAVKVYTRDTTSGTREAFFTGIGFDAAVKSNEGLVDGFVEVDGNGTMRSGVAGDTNGLGYVSLSSLNNTVKALQFDNVEATEDNVNNNTYGLKRPFMFVSRYAGDSSGETLTTAQKEQLLTEAFVAYMSTTEGKAAIQGAGGILAVSAADKSWDDIKSDHVVTQMDNSNITLRFGGSTSVEGVAKALTSLFTPLAGNFKAVHDHTGSGDAAKRTWGGDKDTANKLHIGFASRDFSDSELELFDDATYGRLSWDAVVPVVHPANEASNVTAGLLTDLYNGTVTNWSDVSGSNLATSIKVYTRDTTSGTREAFFTGIGFAAAVKTNEGLVNGFVEVDGNGTMRSGVAGDANGIGYVSLSSLNDTVKALQFDGVDATVDNVNNNTYGLKRPFMFVTRYN